MNTERKILLCVAGVSPSVITETLYALVKQEPAFIPTEIHVVTTLVGVQRLGVLDQGGVLRRFCADFGLKDMPKDWLKIHSIMSTDGIIEDVNSVENSVLCADLLASLVQKFTADTDSILHASLAGGRKTMSFYLGYLMSIYARPQDVLSHVLVDKQYECSDFYYPREETVVTASGEALDAKEARVSLISLPILSARDNLSQAFLQRITRFGEIKSYIRQMQHPPSIHWERGKASFMLHGGTTLELPPLQAAFYQLLLCKTEVNERVSWTAFDTALFLKLLRPLTSPGRFQDVKKTWGVGEGDQHELSPRISEVVSKINKRLTDILGESIARYYRICKIDMGYSIQSSVQLTCSG